MGIGDWAQSPIPNFNFLEIINNQIYNFNINNK